MKPLLTPDEMARCDEATITSGVPGAVLMERAGRAVARAVVSLAGGRYGRTVAVLCGKGNNGGDGFVVSRVLAREGLGVRCYSLVDPRDLDGDASRHATLARRAGVSIRPLQSVVFDGCDVIVDALFGTGFKGGLRSPVADVVAAANSSGVEIVAVDIPSGVNGLTGAVEGGSVEATSTVAMQAQKLGTALPPGAISAGRVTVADIGISVDRADVWMVEERDVTRALPRRDPAGHKRSSGSVAVIGGSPGMSGAPILTARAATRAGAGYVTLCVSADTQRAAAAQAPDLLTRAQSDEKALGAGSLDEFSDVIGRADSVAIGPGLGTGEDQRSLVFRVLSEVEVPVVLDADGLNLLARDTTYATRRRTPLIATPHPAELARLLNADTTSVIKDRLGAARRAADRLGCVIVAKGHRSVIAGPDGRCVINPTGGPALATAGTGDVLTGVVAAFVAAGLEPFDAAYAAAWVHGDTVVRLPSAGAIAGDVAAALPGVIDDLVAPRVRDRLSPDSPD
jgi:NAD(P)H-hydrate epimerase